MRHNVEKQGGNESKWHFVGQVGGGESREPGNRRAALKDTEKGSVWNGNGA